MSDIVKKLNPDIEKYSQNITLRAMVAGIPYIGSPLDVYLSGLGTQIADKRRKMLIDCFTDRLDSFEERVIDKKYIASEEFWDLICKAFRATITTRHQEMISYYADLIRGAVQITTSRSPFLEDFIEILSQLYPEDVLILSAMSDNKLEVPEKHQSISTWRMKIPLENIHQILLKSVPAETFDLSICRLQSKGLVLLKYFDVGVSPEYVLTSFALSLLHYLKGVDKEK